MQLGVRDKRVVLGRPLARSCENNGCRDAWSSGTPFDSPYILSWSWRDGSRVNNELPNDCCDNGSSEIPSDRPCTCILSERDGREVSSKKPNGFRSS
jgi:hypothetical protein